MDCSAILETALVDYFQIQRVWSLIGLKDEPENKYPNQEITFVYRTEEMQSFLLSFRVCKGIFSFSREKQISALTDKFMSQCQVVCNQVGLIGFAIFIWDYVNVSHHDITFIMLLPQLLMEFVGSASLRHSVRSGRRVPFSVLRQYAIDLLSALSYLHKKAVVHKQLSPGSVFLDVSGQLKLANYSICRRYLH